MRRCSRLTDLTDFVWPRQHRKKTDALPPCQTQTCRNTANKCFFIYSCAQRSFVTWWLFLFLFNISTNKTTNLANKTLTNAWQCDAFNFSNPVCEAPASRPFSEQKGQTNVLLIFTWIMLHFKRKCLKCVALLLIIYSADSDDLVLIEFTCYVRLIAHRILSKSTKW